MIKDVKYKNNTLYVGVNEYSYKYYIRSAIVIGNQIVVLLDIPNDENVINNVFSVSPNGKVKWFIQPVNERFPKMQKPLPMESLTYDGQYLLTTDFYGFRYFINPVDGKIIDRDFVK